VRFGGTRDNDRLDEDAVSRQKLSEQEITAALGKLPGWSYENGKLRRVFVCRDFVHAFGLMSSVALAAEALDHHPDWSNSWNKVTIELVTHSSGGVTEMDMKLATKIQEIFGA
jgi:4a-hydroxytetrahydrobiopterin dehydratase